MMTVKLTTVSIRYWSDGGEELMMTVKLTTVSIRYWSDEA